MEEILPTEKIISDATKKNWVKNNIIDSSGKRLKARANKTLSNRQIFPKELSPGGKELLKKLSNLDNWNKQSTLKKLETALMLICNGKIKNINECNSYLKQQIKILSKSIEIADDIKTLFSNLSKELLEEDLLGFIYQLDLKEGNKSKSGSYYTPPKIAKKMVSELDNSFSTFLDPCCGSGQFILSAAEIIGPTKVYGYDIDPIAVKICKWNLLIKFPYDEFIPNIENKNFLTEKKDIQWDFIATNPPWGAKYSKKEKQIIDNNFAENFGYESASLFISKCIKAKGRVRSFLLPESLLYRTRHSKLRKMDFNNHYISSVNLYGAIFSGVQSPVFSISFNNIEKQDSIAVCNKGLKYKIDQNRVADGNWNFYIQEKEHSLLGKIENQSNLISKEDWQWDMGIVTGDNAKYLSKKYKNGYKSILRGRDIAPFTIKNKLWLDFKPESFQQIADGENYKKEKIVYRFIAQWPVTAVETEGFLTLNSANIITTPEHHDVYYISALLNSKVIRYWFHKKFHTRKILKSQMNSIPLPILGSSDKSRISKLSRLLHQKYDQNMVNEIDSILFNHNKLTSSELKIIENSLKEKV